MSQPIALILHHQQQYHHHHHHHHHCSSLYTDMLTFHHPDHLKSCLLLTPSPLPSARLNGNILQTDPTKFSIASTGLTIASLGQGVAENTSTSVTTNLKIDGTIHMHTTVIMFATNIYIESTAQIKSLDLLNTCWPPSYDFQCPGESESDYCHCALYIMSSLWLCIP